MSAPLITSHPINKSQVIGLGVSLTATASGSPSPNVQWQVLVPGGIFVDIGGATSTTYTFTATEKLNRNQYRAVFTNSYGSIATTPITLTVDDIPISSVNKCVGTNAVGATIRKFYCYKGLDLSDNPLYTCATWRLFRVNCPKVNQLCSNLSSAYVAAVTVCNQRLF